jgi:hypothetical protein
MKIISIGHACQIKHQIDKYINQETNFFDWLITDFKSVLYILKNINDSIFLSREKFTKDWVFKNCDSWHLSCHKVEHKEIKMISIHEFPANVPYESCLDDYIDTYKRRLNRLKEYIQSDINIHFIHMIDHQFTDPYIPTKEDIEKFCEIIYNINKKCKFYLHLAVSPETVVEDDFWNNNETNIYKYRLKDIHNIEINWENNNFNWEQIFDNILFINK